MVYYVSSTPKTGHGITTIAAPGDKMGHHGNGWVVFIALPGGDG